MAAASVTPPGSLDLLQPGFSKTLLGTKLEDKYLCSACKNVLRRPFQAQCGHRYCSSCLSNILRWAHGGGQAVVSWGQSSHSSVSLVGTAQSDRAAGSRPFCSGRPRPRGAGRRGQWPVLRTVSPVPASVCGVRWHTLACACWPPYLVAVKVPGPWGGSGGWQGLLAVGSRLTGPLPPPAPGPRAAPPACTRAFTRRASQSWRAAR